MHVSVSVSCDTYSSLFWDPDFSTVLGVIDSCCFSRSCQRWLDQRCIFKVSASGSEPIHPSVAQSTTPSAVPYPHCKPATDRSIRSSPTAQNQPESAKFSAYQLLCSAIPTNLLVEVSGPSLLPGRKVRSNKYRYSIRLRSVSPLPLPLPPKPPPPLITALFFVHLVALRQPSIG